MFLCCGIENSFAQATTNLDTVCWNEKIDIDPEDLYWNGFLETEQK